MSLLLLFAGTGTPTPPGIVARPGAGETNRPGGNLVDYAADPLPRPETGVVDQRRDLVQRP